MAVPLAVPSTGPSVAQLGTADPDTVLDVIIGAQEWYLGASKPAAGNGAQRPGSRAKQAIGLSWPGNNRWSQSHRSEHKHFRFRMPI